MKTENTFQANDIGIHPYLNKLVVDFSNSSDTIVENKNIKSTQNTDHISFSKWDDIKILSYVVNSKHDVRLKSGQQIINNYSKTDRRMPYHFVDTSYCKEYFRKLKCMLSNDVKSKWLGDKKTTLADQLSLYKCSGKNCKRVFSNQQLFRNHLNYHHHSNSEWSDE
ncbi:putative histone-lysine N-methyltransferase 1 [Aphis craccivora]|uniref:Putative histone-lysine N-methyltransferase 1 n=1 Tax=Aphis craccivora TaxID=307492 RepID=A0A6G0Y1L2_APHCR|nr:putative histone-lysine N-methyltransferase 1 [Aphis craccivora]